MLADQDKKQKHDFFKMGSCHFEIFFKVHFYGIKKKQNKHVFALHIQICMKINVKSDLNFINFVYILENKTKFQVLVKCEHESG